MCNHFEVFCCAIIAFAYILTLFQKFDNLVYGFQFFTKDVGGMISFDLECEKEHRFEGFFKDYQSFEQQLKNNLIACPLCNSTNIKRLFSGCSIQARPVSKISKDKQTQTIFELVKELRSFVEANFENVGRNFPEIARAIYYGIEEARGIYGESTLQEMKELAEEGIPVLPLPDIEKLEN